MFAALIVALAVLCMFIAPALTSGSIAGELEQKSLEMLLLCRLSVMNIALSKLLSAIGVLLLMLLCTMPVAAITLYLGGISLGQVMLGYALVLAIGIYGGAVGLYFSARTSKTANAIILANLVTLLWCIGVPATCVAHNTLQGIRDSLIFPGINLLDMLFPVLLISAIFSAFTHRAMPWWAAVIIWLVLSVPLCTWSALNSAAFIPDGLIFSFIGNPALAMVSLLLDVRQGIYSPLTQWCATHLVELTLPIL